MVEIICPYIIREDKILQEQFTQLYNKLLKYAYYRAGRYFRDSVLREDAAADAVNEAVDKWIADDCYDEETAKRVIQSSLRQASRKRELEPIESDEEGTHGYKIL